MVYKYRSADRLDFFENKMLRLTQLSDLKGSVDCTPRYVIKDIEREVRQLIKRNRSKAQLIYGAMSSDVEKKVQRLLGCGVLRQVVYYEEPLKVDVTDLKLPIDIFFTKRTAYTSENEVRMIREVDNCDTRVKREPYVRDMV